MYIPQGIRNETSRLGMEWCNVTKFGPEEQEARRENLFQREK